MASFQWLVACDDDRKACYGNENNTTTKCTTVQVERAGDQMHVASKVE